MLHEKVYTLELLCKACNSSEEEQELLEKMQAELLELEEANLIYVDRKQTPWTIYPLLYIGGQYWLQKDFINTSLAREENHLFAPEDLNQLIPQGWKLPTTFDFLQALKKSGIDIYTNLDYTNWDIKALTQEGLQLNPPRYTSGYHSSYYCRDSQGTLQLFKLYSSQNHYHYTFTKEDKQAFNYLRFIKDIPQSSPYDTAHQQITLWQADLIKLLEKSARQRYIQQIITAVELLEQQRYLLWDKRDHYLYKVTNINGLYWLADDLSHQSAGSLVEDSFYEEDILPFGRVFYKDINSARQACPVGCRLPTEEEWQDMFRQFGGLTTDFHNDTRHGIEALLQRGKSHFNLRWSHDDFLIEEEKEDNSGYKLFWTAEGKGIDMYWDLVYFHDIVKYAYLRCIIA